MGLLSIEIEELGASWLRAQVWNILHRVPSGGVKRQLFLVLFSNLGSWSQVWDRLIKLGVLDIYNDL